MQIEIFDEKLNLFGLFLGEVTGWFYSKFSKIFVSFIPLSLESRLVLKPVQWFFQGALEIKISLRGRLGYFFQLFTLFQ